MQEQILDIVRVVPERFTEIVANLARLGTMAEYYAELSRAQATSVDEQVA